jgi:hypothetical protein
MFVHISIYVNMLFSKIYSYEIKDSLTRPASKFKTAMEQVKVHGDYAPWGKWSK